MKINLKTAGHMGGFNVTDINAVISYEPRREKTGLRDFRPGLTQTDLYSHRSGLEA